MHKELSSRGARKIPAPNTTLRQLALGFAVVCVLGTSRLAAATYYVNSTEDRPDSDPLDGVCSAAVTGACTLRAAIMEANVAIGPDMIVVPAGTYQITRVHFDDTALGGDLDIADPVTIQGAGSAHTIIDANGEVTNDRAIQVLQVSGAVTITGFTLRNGKTDTAQTSFRGGAIHSKAGGLYLNDVRIADSTAYEGGGFFGAEGSSVVMNHCVVENNKATNTWGGGMWAERGYVELHNVLVRGNTAAARGGGCGFDGVALTVTDSIIDGNTAQSGYGGGFVMFDVILGKVTRTEFSNNTAGTAGGAVFSESGYSVAFTECHVHHNVANVRGGGIDTVGPLKFDRCVIETNSATNEGGGLNVSNLRFPDNTIEVRVENSTMHNNSAQFGAAIYYNQTSDSQNNHSLLLRNSTIAQNTASREGGGIYAKGVARIFSQSATIARNGVFRPTGIGVRGGGILLTDTARIFAANTLVADNHTASALNPGTPDDIYTTAGAFFDLGNGYNLVETTTNVAFTGTTFACIFNQDPKLNPAGLANNGGATPTLALGLGSPAWDKGSSVAPPTDQRGFLRNGLADIGAYEFNGDVPAARIESAVSRKQHGALGDFDVPLVLFGQSTIDPRTGGPNGEHTIIITFANGLKSIGGATVTSAAGEIIASGPGPEPDQYSVTISNAPNAQNVTVTLHNVTDGFDYFSSSVNVSLGLLLGDSNDDRVVNSGDAQQTRNRSGQTVDAANFRSDFNLDGTINSGDAAVVRSRSGHFIP